MHSHPSGPQQVCEKHGGGSGAIGGGGGGGGGVPAEGVFPAPAAFAASVAFTASAETTAAAPPEAAFAAAAASMSWHMQSPCALRTPHPHPLEALSSRTRATHRPWMHLYWLQSGLGQPYRASENPTSSAPLQSGSCAPALQSHPSHAA